MGTRDGVTLTPHADRETLIGSSSVRAPNQDARVHCLPCTIQHDGPASVATYFSPKEAAGEGADVQEVAFRGRLLKGIPVPCPPGMVGVVAREASLPPDLAEKYSSSKTRFLSVESQFREMTYWEHDSAPGRDHALYGLGEYIEVAKSIHED